MYEMCVKDEMYEPVYDMYERMAVSKARKKTTKMWLW